MQRTTEYKPDSKNVNRKVQEEPQAEATAKSALIPLLDLDLFSGFQNVMHQKNAEEIANSGDLDQTAPQGAI